MYIRSNKLGFSSFCPPKCVPKHEVGAVNGLAASEAFHHRPVLPSFTASGVEVYEDVEGYEDVIVLDKGVMECQEPALT